MYEKDLERLWEQVSRTGTGTAADRTGYSRSKIYGWKSRDLFIPAEFVSKFINPGEVKALKGGGRAEPIRNLKFPIEEREELAARRNSSVAVNSDGVPIYQASDRGNLERFAALLEDLGSTYTVYSRETLELRYPRFVDRIIREFPGDRLAAAIDESGEITENGIKIDGETIPLEKFSGRLYSSKRLELALQRGDREELSRIMSEQARRASTILD